MTTLYTNRLMIRDHVPQDLMPLHSLLSNKTAMYYLPDIATTTLEESAANLEESISQSHLPLREKYFLGILMEDTLQYMGEIGFTVKLDTPFGRIVGLGYFILPEYWGKGFVAEAAREVLRFAFEEANVIKVETGCIKDNKGSERVMQKIGMNKEAEFKMHVWHDHKLKDRVEYGLTRDEWAQLK